MRISHLVVAGSLLVVPATSFAFRAEPSKDAKPTEFGRRDLSRVPDAKRQAALTASQAWSDFLAAHPGAWNVTWDDRAGTPREIAGGTIVLVPASASAAQVESASRTFLRTLQALSGVDEALLQTKVLTKRGDTWYVRFDRLTAAGVPVEGAYAELRIRAGKVTLIRLETHPMADGAQPAKLTAAQGAKRAHDALGKFTAASFTAKTRAAVVPVAVGAGWEYRPAFIVDSHAGRASRYRSTVDALYGEVLARESLVRWTVEGDVFGSIEHRTHGDPLTAEPLPFLRSNVGGNVVDANVSGHWTSGGNAPAAVTQTLTGPFVRVFNESGPEGSASFEAMSATGNDFTWTTANATQSEIAAYRHAETARQWALTVNPSLGWLQQQLAVNVLINDECNAYWDGSSINFFRGGSNCNDTARIADVVYHEFGHGFHQENAVSGTIDGAIGEGTGDFLAATITNSALVGPFFFVDGDPVREMETDRVYPDDLVGESHEDGLIWAGALWDLRKALVSQLGESMGRSTIDQLFQRTLEAGPTLDQVYTEMLLADDDDGNLENGTPNQCTIESAFGSHGLSGTSALFANIHQEVSGIVDGNIDIPVTVQPPAQVGACAATIEAVTVRYRVDGGSPESTTLTAAATDFEGAIPAPGDGHLIRYWMEVELAGGGTVTVPAGAPTYRYAFFTGTTHTVYSEGFEDGEEASGWTHDGTGDDWEVGSPNGNAGDPEDAYAGANVLGNDLSGAYQGGANNYAESPEINCGDCVGTRLRLRRWVSVEDGTWDQTRILVNGTPFWSNPVEGWNGPPMRDPFWSYEDFDISSVADGEKITIRFELQADEAVEYGGWNVDDVEVASMSEVGPGGDGGNGPAGCACALDTTSRGATASTYAAALLGFAAIVASRRRRT